MKHCSACDQDLPTESFYLSKGKLSCYCKVCWKERVSKKAPKKTKQQRKHYWLKSRFNITYADYEVLYASQGGMCAICGKHIEEFATTSDLSSVACVDHNHTTGEVRGLLCNHCNTGIGLLQENPVILQSAINYLIDRGVK